MLNELRMPNHSIHDLIVDLSQHLSLNIGLERRFGTSTLQTLANQLGALATITDGVTTKG